MPRSKHRRNAGGKAVKRPGHGKALRTLPLSADEIAYKRFKKIYHVPLYDTLHHHESAHFMFDFVSAVCFNAFTRMFHAIPREELFASFMKPLKDEYGNASVFTHEEAVAALAFLAEQGMVTIEGDQVMIPSRFVDAFFQSFENDSATSTVSVG